MALFGKVGKWLYRFPTRNLKKTTIAAQKIKSHRVVAEAIFKQDFRPDIPLSSHDFCSLQARALQEGIPCQNLAFSILHKLVDGRLVEKTWSQARLINC